MRGRALSKAEREMREIERRDAIDFARAARGLPTTPPASHCTCTVNTYRGEPWASPEYYAHEDPTCPVHAPTSPPAEPTR